MLLMKIYLEYFDTFFLTNVSMLFPNLFSMRDLGGMFEGWWDDEKWNEENFLMRKMMIRKMEMKNDKMNGDEMDTWNGDDGW